MSATPPAEPIRRVRMGELAERYSALLLDAYGVLITHDGVLPGAPELIGRLRAVGKPFFILTNDASRSPEHSAERYRSLRLPIEPAQIITSGWLLRRYFAEQRLAGALCAVLGPEDSLQYVRDAGGAIVDLGSADDADAVVICDERGFDLLPSLDRVLSLLFRRLDAGQSVHRLVPNPDVIYPAGAGRYGFTAGSLAVLFEAALRLRYPERDDLAFVRLGKPHRAIYDEALRRIGTRNVVMVGDQLATDIRGAATVGLDSALVTTGLTQLDAAGVPRGGFPPGARPTYLLADLRW